MQNPPRRSARIPSVTQRVGVVVVDDHEIAREGIRSRLELEPDIEILAELPNADDLIPVCEKAQPHIVLMDIDMPGADPFTVIADLRRMMPHMRVIILSAYMRDGYVDAAVQAGSWGYLSKNESFDEITKGIRRVLAGELAFAPQVLERFEFSNGQLRRRSDSSASPLSTLTPRELEVMRLIAKGLSTKEIAGILHRSPKTIDAHRTSLMRKLNIDDRVELTRYAIREGIVEP
jgi:DNA-binding NarL/FixJ family response regulator